MRTVIIALTSILLLSYQAEGQILKRVSDRAKYKVKSRTESKTDRAIDRGLDKIEDGIDNLFKKKENNNQQQSAPAPSNPSNNQYNNSPSPSQQSNNNNSGNNSSEHTDYSQYKGSNFIPGKNVLFFEDFSSAKIGNAKGDWYLYDYNNGRDEVAPGVKKLKVSNDNWFKSPRTGFYFPNSFSQLPEQFTLEFDLYADPNIMTEMEGGFRTVFVQKSDRANFDLYFESEKMLELDVHPHGNSQMVRFTANREYQSSNSTKEIIIEVNYKNMWLPDQVNKVAISRNGSHVIAYLNGKEIFNQPNSLMHDGQYHLIFANNQWQDGLYFTNVRVAGDIQNATQEIKNEGKFVTNTIYFDINSSKIKAESWSTLNNVATAIKSSNNQYLIVGHTDSDGSDEANLKLSLNRAISVKNTLVKEFGIDLNRLITEGKGESNPITSNQTANGKAQNRRVEFIKK